MKKNTSEVAANVGATATMSKSAGNMELSTCWFDWVGLHLFSVCFECQSSSSNLAIITATHGVLTFLPDWCWLCSSWPGLSLPGGVGDIQVSSAVGETCPTAPAGCSWGRQPCNACLCISCKSSYTPLIQKPPLVQTPSTVSIHATKADLLLSHLQTSHRDPVCSFYLAKLPKHVPYLLQWRSKRCWSPAWCFQKELWLFHMLGSPPIAGHVTLLKA